MSLRWSTAALLCVAAVLGALAVESPRRATAAPGDISTYAGGGAGDGTAPLNAAVSPGGVAVDASGNLFFADTANCRVRMLTPGGVISTVAGTGVCGYGGDGGPATSARLNFPQSVAVSGSGELYIADTVNCRVRVVDTLGSIATFAGTGVCVFGGDGGAAASAQLASPEGVAVSGADVYIADGGNCRVRKVSGGAITTFAGSPSCGFAGDGGPATSASLSHPAGVWADGVGNVYIADTNNCRVRVVGFPAGTISTVAGTGACTYTGDGVTAYTSGLNKPRAVATDAAGDLYIADTYNCRVRKVSYPTVTISTIAGDGDCNIGGDGGAATAAKVQTPAGIAVSGADFWIGDTGNCRARKVTSGVIATIAGTGWCQYGGDGGPATNAAMNTTSGVALDAAGNLYVADTNNCRIRKVTPGGVISTFAGTGACAYGGDGGPATAATLNQPHGLAVDGAGALYIADTNNCRIRRVTAGTITTIAGTSCGYSGDGGAATAAMLNLPQSIAVHQNSVYIADTFNCRIRRITGTTITTHAGDGACTYDGDGGSPAMASFTFPYGVAVDGSGIVYVADTYNCRVRKIAGGTVLAIAGTGVCGYSGDLGPGAAAAVDHPEGLTVTASGAVYIADTANCRVRLLAGSTIVTAAGSGVCAFGGDGGSASSAALNRPVSIAVEASGAVFVADSLNDRVRRLEAGADMDGDGVVNTSDNCVTMSNAGQENTDANFVDQSPPHFVDDHTWINSDGAGDACDADDDNDGLADAAESSGASCGGIPTDPLLRDTDGDFVLDGAECAMGFDPTSPASKPTQAQCAAYLGVASPADTDGDGLRDLLEFCGYNSDRLNKNTDGDTCADGKEVATLNTDERVNSGDQLLLAQETLRVLGGGIPVPNIDMNKDGNINSGDQLLLAQQFGNCVV